MRVVGEALLGHQADPRDAVAGAGAGTAFGDRLAVRPAVSTF